MDMSDFHEDRNEPTTDVGAESFASWQQDSPQAERIRVARRVTADRNDAVFDLAAIAAWLPRLGAVLWLDRGGRRHAPIRATIGAGGVLLLDHPALAALARCTSASAHTQVTSHGPREWLSFRDVEGVPIAKLFLLPDTDYLTWDEMISATHLAPPVKEPMRWHAHTAFLRTALARLGAHWQARLLTFDHRRLPWLQTLDARPPLRLSLLGLELARLIVHSEGAELLSPLHAG
jgi:hypothetical protein